MFIALKLLFILTNIIIAAYDFAYYRIPNALILALLILYAIFAPLFLTPVAILLSILMAGLAFVIGLGLFRMRIIGTGDIKYFTVIALWAGLPHFAPFLFYTALIGGIIGVFSQVFFDLFLRSSQAIWTSFQNIEIAFPHSKKIWSLSGGGKEPNQRDKVDRRVIPFGLAIAGGAILIACLHFSAG